MRCVLDRKSLGEDDEFLVRFYNFLLTVCGASFEAEDQVWTALLSPLQHGRGQGEQ